jgi:hypothetical protein
MFTCGTFVMSSGPLDSLVVGDDGILLARVDDFLLVG